MYLTGAVRILKVLETTEKEGRDQRRLNRGRRPKRLPTRGVHGSQTDPAPIKRDLTYPQMVTQSHRL